MASSGRRGVWVLERCHRQNAQKVGKPCVPYNVIVARNVTSDGRAYFTFEGGSWAERLLTASDSHPFLKIGSG